jgi:glycosyltransferase involved in cell wall biosynthesis
VSVIIPTFQRRDLAVAAVESLGDQTVDHGSFEVVVVVDGSTDGTADRLRSMSVPVSLTVVERENQGKGAACNAGARAASGEILLVLDDDMKADRRMIAEHLRAYEELRADAVVGLIEHDPESPVNVISDEVRREFEHDAREWGDAFGPLPPDRLFVGAQFSVRSALYRAVGGFDESYTRRGRYGHADQELGIRLRAAGARIMVNAKAVSRQTFVRGFDSVWQQYFGYGQADVRLGRQHPSEAHRLWTLPRGGMARAIATATLRFPSASSRVGELLRPMLKALYNRGSSGPLVRKLTYSLLFHHRYWAGVASARGRRELDVRGRRLGG